MTTWRDYSEQRIDWAGARLPRGVPLVSVLVRRSGDYVYSWEAVRSSSEDAAAVELRQASRFLALPVPIPGTARALTGGIGAGAGIAFGLERGGLLSLVSLDPIEVVWARLSLRRLGRGE